MTLHVMDSNPCRVHDRDMTNTDSPHPTVDIAPDVAARTVAGFLELWNAADPAVRRAAIERTYADDGCFSDPTAQITGHDAIEQHVIGTMAIFGGRTFRQAGDIDVHHDRLRFSWEMVAPDGTVELHGLDVVHLAADGRMVDSTGFFVTS